MSRQVMMPYEVASSCRSSFTDEAPRGRTWGTATPQFLGNEAPKGLQNGRRRQVLSSSDNQKSESVLGRNKKGALRLGEG